MVVNHMFDKIIDKIRTVDSYKKRGFVYLTISALLLGYELFFHDPPRRMVILLWLGIIVIAISVMVSLKDSDR